MSSSVSKAGVVSFEEARRIVEEHAAKVRLGVVQSNVVQSNNAESGHVEVLDLPAARGRIWLRRLWPTAISRVPARDARWLCGTRGRCGAGSGAA